MLDGLDRQGYGGDSHGGQQSQTQSRGVGEGPHVAIPHVKQRGECE